MKSGSNEGKQMDPLFPRLHLGSAERGGPRAPPRNKMALCEQLSVPSPKFNPGSTPMLSLPISSSSLGPSSSSSRDNSYRRSLFSSFHSIHDSMHLMAARLDHQSSGMNFKTTASQPIKMTNHQIVCHGGHLNSRGFSSPSARNSRTYYVKKLVDEDDYTVPTLFQPGNISNCVEGQRKAEKENLTSSSMSSYAYEKQSCHDTSLQQECRLLAENMTTRKISASTVEGLSVSRSSLGEGHDQNHNEIGTTDECGKKQDCGSTQVGAEKKGDITNTSAPGLRISPDAVEELFGQKQFWKARRTIIHQQRVFAQQVFELHRLIMLQRTVAASPQLLFKDNFYLGRKEQTPFVAKPRVDSQKPSSAFAFTAGNTVKRSPLLNNDADNHISDYKPIPLLYPPLSTTIHLPPGNQWLVPVRSPSEGLVYKPYTGPCPPPASLLAPYGCCGPISLTPAPGNFLTPAYGVPEGLNNFSGSSLGQTYIPPYVVPMIKQSSHSAVETAISLARAPISSATHGNSTTTYKTNRCSHKKGTISGCTPNLQALKETNSQGDAASCKDELPLFPTAPTAEATSDQPSRSTKSDDQSVKAIKVVPHNPKLASESAARIFQSIQEERNQAL